MRDPCAVKYVGRVFQIDTHSSFIRKHMQCRIVLNCDLCSYNYNSQRLLGSHMMIHTDQTPFQCDDCYQSFRQKQLLKRHKNYNAFFIIKIFDFLNIVAGEVGEELGEEEPEVQEGVGELLVQEVSRVVEGVVEEEEEEMEEEAEEEVEFKPVIMFHLVVKRLPHDFRSIVSARRWFKSI